MALPKVDNGRNHSLSERQWKVRRSRPASSTHIAPSPAQRQRQTQVDRVRPTNAGAEGQLDRVELRRSKAGRYILRDAREERPQERIFAIIANCRASWTTNTPGEASRRSSHDVRRRCLIILAKLVGRAGTQRLTEGELDEVAVRVLQAAVVAYRIGLLLAAPRQGSRRRAPRRRRGRRRPGWRRRSRDGRIRPRPDCSTVPAGQQDEDNLLLAARLGQPDDRLPVPALRSMDDGESRRSADRSGCWHRGRERAAPRA